MKINFAYFKILNLKNKLNAKRIAPLFLAKKIDSFLKILPSPQLFTVELTNRCNLNCLTCLRDKMERAQGHIDFETFKKIVDESKRFRFPIHWLHHLGESLLHPNLGKMLHYFYQNGLGPGGISTNGLLLNGANINIIKKYCKIILVALNSSRKNVYQVIKNDNNYNIVCDNIKKLIELSKNSQLEIRIQVLKSRLNKDETGKELEEIFGRNRNVFFHVKDIELFPGGNDFRADIKLEKNIQKCQSPYSELIIHYNGDAAFCCYVYDSKQIIGNVKNNNLFEIWNGRKAKELRQELKNGNFDNLSICSQCVGKAR